MFVKNCYYFCNSTAQSVIIGRSPCDLHSVFCHKWRHLVTQCWQLQLPLLLKCLLKYTLAKCLFTCKYEIKVLSTIPKIYVLKPNNFFNIYNVNIMILQNVKQNGGKKFNFVLQKGRWVSFLKSSDFTTSFDNCLFPQKYQSFRLDVP